MSLNSQLNSLGEQDRKEYILNKITSLINKKEIGESIGVDLTKYYMESIILEKDLGKAAECLHNICVLDKQITAEKESKKLLKEYEVFIVKRNLYLKESDWSQLPDVDLDRKEKEDYRKYRKYLRNLPELYKTKVVDKLEVLDMVAYKKSYLYSI